VTALDILSVVLNLFTGLFEHAIEVLFTPVFDFLEGIALSPASLKEMNLINNSYEAMLGIGYGIFFLLLIWLGFKSMFAWAGVQTEEPHYILFRALPVGFLVWAIGHIMFYFVGAANEMIIYILDPGYTFKNLSGEMGMFFFLPGSMGGIRAILGIVGMIAFVTLAYKMFVRLVMCAFLIICSPLAAATLLSKVTSGFFDGFIKLFVGNIIIQLIQSLALISLFRSIGSAFLSSDLFSIMLVIAIISVNNKLEDIVRDISISVGIGRDMQGALSKVQTVVYTAGSVRGLIK